jgi:sRNA-binding protein
MAGCAPEKGARSDAPSREQAIRERRAAVKNFRARLAIECPDTFSPFDHGLRVALAIGIHRQLAERYADVPTKTRRLALKEYTGSAAYLLLLIAGAPRVDITGAVSGAVTQAEAEHAAEKVKDLMGGRFAAMAAGGR